MVEKAKELCEDLLGNVKEQYEEFKNRPPRSYGGQGGYGERSHGSNSYQGHHHHNNSSGYNNSPAPVTPSAASPPPAASGAPGAADYAAQYAQYYGTGAADPYAAYGGYAA